MNNSFIDKLSNFFHGGKNHLTHMIIMIFGSVFVYFLVYETGGTQNSYPYLCIVLIIYAAAIFKLKGAFVMAIVTSFLMGPIMPINTITGEMQEVSNYMVRFFFYLLTALFAGTFSYLNYRNYNDMKKTLTHDPINGIPIFTSLFQEIPEFLDLPNDYSMILFRFNNYKSIQQITGISQYYELLKRLYNEIIKVYSEEQTFFQINSNLFLLLVPGDETDNALKYLESIFDKPFESTNMQVYIDVFFSITSATPNIKDDLQKGQSSLNHGIDNNNKITYFKQDHVDSYKHTEYLGSFPNELEEGNLYLVYQPVTLSDGKTIKGVEILSRWTHSVVGPISPGLFIPYLEETHQINKLTRWLVRESIKHIHTMPDYCKDMVFSFNVSSINLKDQYTMDTIIEEFTNSDIPMEQLVCEITETSILEDSDELKAAIFRLKDAGFTIAIDDFGKGYSTLSYLHKYPVDIIKIDQYFVFSMKDNKALQTIVKSTIDLAHALGKKVQAEGINDQQTITLLRDMGVDYLQGYELSKPLKKEKLCVYITNIKAN